MRRVTFPGGRDGTWPRVAARHRDPCEIRRSIRENDMTRSIKRLPLALACTLLASVAAAAPPVATPANATQPVAASPMLGFTTDRAAAQRSLEQRFDAALSASDPRE